MPEFLAPGVYVEEVSSGIKPIEGVSTGIVGFIGLTERGPIGVRCITGFADYQRIYGGISGTKFLPDAIKGFFDNGGRRAFVSRSVTANDQVAAARLPDAAGCAVEAIGPGDWGRRLRMLVVETGERRLRLLIDYYDVDIPDAEFVNPIASAALLNGRRPSRPAHREDYSLVLDPGGPANVNAIINRRSSLIRTRVQRQRTFLQSQKKPRQNLIQSGSRSGRAPLPAPRQKCRGSISKPSVISR
jgi:Bacteriophage tail sheath protein